MCRVTASIWIGLLALSATPAVAQPARISSVVAQVRADRIKQDVAALAGVGDRFIHSKQFIKATHLVRDRLVAAGLSTRLEAFTAQSRVVHNVVAELPGTLPGRGAIVVSAHYDAINVEGHGPAPGAEDNASGTAALLETARVLARHKLATSVRFVAFAAEEQGLLGSKHRAQLLQKHRATATVQAVINMDMVGYAHGAPPHVLVDTFRSSRALAARVSLAAAAHSSTRVSAGIFSQGRSDHRPYVDVGVPAVTLASAWWRHYPNYHSGQDLPSSVDPAAVAAAARVAVAAVLRLAGFADGAPVAHGGRFVQATAQRPVQLSAAASFDPRGQPLSYRWTQTGGPTVQLTTAGATLRFVPPEPGSFRFKLEVSAADGRRSEPDLAAALVSDQPGCATAGNHRGRALPWSALLALLLLARRRVSSPAAR